MKEFNKKIVLENGEEYYGYGFGADKESICEIVFNTSKILSSDQNLQIGNDAEIIELTKTGGSSIVSTPGNYNPTKEETYEPDSAYAEELIVTGPTGENRNYISFIIIGLVSLGIILVGTIIIKKKVLK